MVGPIPQGFYTPLSNGVPPSSIPVIQGNLYKEGGTSPDKVVTIGTALRLPQNQLQQPTKQPAPALTYDSQLLASRKFEPRPTSTIPKRDTVDAQSKQAGGLSHNQPVRSSSSSQIESTTVMSVQSQMPGLQNQLSQNHSQAGNCPQYAALYPQSVQPSVSQPSSQYQTTHFPCNPSDQERPKAHIYAWTSPPPVEDEQIRNTYHNAHPQTSNANNHTNRDQQEYSNSNTNHSNASIMHQNYSDHLGVRSGTSSGGYSVVGDHVMATNVHPTTSRTTSTAATPTCVYQSLVQPTANKQSTTYTQAGYNTLKYPEMQKGQGYTMEIPKGQGQQPGTTLTSVGAYPSATGLRFLASAPSSFANYQNAGDAARLNTNEDSNQEQTAQTTQKTPETGLGKHFSIWLKRECKRECLNFSLFSTSGSIENSRQFRNLEKQQSALSLNLQANVD